MTRLQVMRLSVVRNWKLVGSVSRANLVRAFFSPRPNLCRPAASVATVGAQ